MIAMAEKVLYLENVGFQYSSRTGFFGRDYYKAITDITFDVSKGETLGLIGRNGCGKSTLLKLIANIYKPDTGRIQRHCKKISLLSLALGFDPELPGFQNAVLSSMLLGASKFEALSKIDEIVDFAELNEFIYKPVKTYSNGMRARLGFAVALKMKADILLIDEVLGVGDINFIKKAEDAICQRIYSDQTVLLVSHAFGLVNKLCDRVIWLEGGAVRLNGEPSEVIAEYKAHMPMLKGVGNISLN